ncbi:MAG: thiopurine S-methyltransferase [Amphritea sp.]|nr:thiopurine S-methyltransferase [Amphritea sp.]
MHSDFWHDRWAEGRIGFHLPESNPLLKRGWSALNAQGEGRVLVPLCGKTLDMLWLREQGHEVLGVELSELACQAFFDEQEVVVEKRERDGFQVRSVDGLDLYCGDFFALPQHCYDSVAWVYDRAALVAFPPEMRKQYVQSLIEKLPSCVSILLITLEFDELQGPPFSVNEAEVRELYGQRFDIEKLFVEQSEGKGGRLETETMYVLKDRACG